MWWNEREAKPEMDAICRKAVIDRLQQVIRESIKGSRLNETADDERHDKLCETEF